MKPAACAHHWIALDSTSPVAVPARREVTLGCILCFKYALATFEPIGFKLDAATVKAMRRRKS